MPSRDSFSAHAHRCPRTAHRRTPTPSNDSPRHTRSAQRRGPMATHTLSILKPSVNNLSARIFIRAAGLDFDEVDMWGNKGTTEFLSKDPADLTPLLEESGLPNGSLWESCAIMQYICNRDGLEDFYPS